jgi:hypothetical protein
VAAWNPCGRLHRRCGCSRAGERRRRIVGQRAARRVRTRDRRGSRRLRTRRKMDVAAAAIGVQAAACGAKIQNPIITPYLPPCLHARYRNGRLRRTTFLTRTQVFTSGPLRCYCRARPRANANPRLIFAEALGEELVWASATSICLLNYSEIPVLSSVRRAASLGIIAVREGF